MVQRLTTLPGIGPTTATAFVAAVDNVQRFGGRRGAARVASYLGLVPVEHSSGEQQRRGRVLRSAHPYVQALLVEAAWRVWRSADPRTAALRPLGTPLGEAAADEDCVGGADAPSHAHPVRDVAR